MKSLLHWVAAEDKGKAEEAFGLGSKIGKDRAKEGEVIELRFNPHRDASVYVELSVRRIRRANGEYGYQCIARNIDARKQSEAHLIRARNAYYEADQAKSSFLAMMSHELRTPMNGVLGMTQLLLKSGLDAKQKDQAQTILASSQAMMKLIHDLLDISRIEAGQMSLVEEPIDLVELAEEVLGTLSTEADRKQLDLTLYFTPRMRRKFLGDATRLRQVLLNLVGNGIKFTHKGGVAVRVSEGAKNSGRQYIRVEVKDTGIGLGKMDKKDLFGTFVQLDSSNTRKFGGAGLGLSICKRIVQAMEGVIGVESSSFQGASFWFELPLKIANEHSSVRTPPVKLEAGAHGILVVSDNYLVRDYFTTRAHDIQQKAICMAPEELMDSFSTWEKNESISFHTVVLDIAHITEIPFQLTPEVVGLSLKRGMRWVVLDSPSRNVPFKLTDQHQMLVLKIANPLTESVFHTFCQFLSNPDTSTTDPMEVPESTALADTKEGGRESAAKSDLKVLVAEDDPINQKLILHFLKKTGFTSRIVSDGHQVLKKLEEESFDVVLMDCSMPVMDGFEATRRIRKNPKFNQLQIIALTAHSLKGDRERCLEAGMNDYMAKPLNLDSLTQKLVQINTDNRINGH